MPTTRRMIVQIVIVLVALIALLVGYYWVHKPLSFGLVQTLGGALLDLLTAAALAAVAGGVGRRALTRADLSPASRAERVALQGLIGLGMVAWVALALGLVGLFSGIALWLALAVAGVLVRRDVRDWLLDVRALARRVARPANAWTYLLTAITALLLLLALLNALAPPFAWDALLYHLVGPQRYLAAGRIVTLPDNHFMGFPQGAELVYGVAMSLLGRDTAAAPVHYLFGLLALLATAGLVRRYADDSAGWLAAVLLVGGFSLWALFGAPYVDLAVMAYGAAAFASIVCWGETRRTGWLVMAGLCAGLALGVKYTAVALLLALAVYIAVRAVALHAPRQLVRNVLILGGVAALAFVPWMVKGILLYHNPVYPYFFGGVNWDAERTRTFNTSGTGLLGSGSEWQLAVLPFAATVFGVERGAGYSFTAGPWLLTAWFLLLPGWSWLDERARRLARDCLILGAPLFVFWLAMAALTGIGEQTRLVSVGLPVAAAAGSLGFYSLSCWPRKPLDLYFIVRAVLVITLALGLIEVFGATVNTGTVRYLLASTSRDSYLTDNLGTYINAMRRLGELPAGSTVRLMWEPRAYYCPATVTCIPDILFDQWSHPIRSGRTSDEVFQDWKGQGDDYLLLFQAGYNFAVEDKQFAAENSSFPAALDRRMVPVWSDGLGGYTLYAWRTQ